VRTGIQGTSVRTGSPVAGLDVAAERRGFSQGLIADVLT